MGFCCHNLLLCTPLVWSNIEPTLILFLEIHKTERLKRERVALIKKRHQIFISVIEDFAHQHRPEIVPPVRKMYEMEGIKSILNAQSESTVTSANFKTIIEPQLPGFTKEWRQTKDIELLSLIPVSEKYTNPDDHQISELALATTLFHCEICRTTISYPRVLVHDCAFDEHLDLIMTLNSKLSNPVLVRFDSWAHALARDVVKLCDLNPDTTTTSEMNKGKYWFEVRSPIQRCHERYKTFMRWSTVVTVCDYSLCQISAC